MRAVGRTRQPTPTSASRSPGAPCPKGAGHAAACRWSAAQTRSAARGTAPAPRFLRAACSAVTTRRRYAAVRCCGAPRRTDRLAVRSAPAIGRRSRGEMLRCSAPPPPVRGARPSDRASTP
ncbi:hypothetical protein STRAU_1578 [Streptomyces aurantiacus JA 4570]|uniref:Uncharacterized protein n=1 Tax=Streptomyces aurantiacus JA 4570 TaxID=1286094 RepID=S3ZQ22_9ACTN|nr:hypothetical protein STRAU_1578 [Streptomyces aurantiacus JA 4570]